MRRLICRSLPRWVLTLGGLTIAAVAIAAYPLGLDTNPAMGARRVALLALGLAAALFAQAGTIRRWLGAAPPPNPRPDAIPQDLQVEPALPPQPPGLRLWLPLSFALLAILGFYVWLVTSGDPAHPPSTTLFYNMLAEAFASGQTHLKAVPDPRLADLTNPYDPAEHGHIPRCREGQTADCLLFDATYYDGKYYLYWGPAPAALLAPLRLVGVDTVSDGMLALIGAVALFGFTAAFFVLAWRRFFASLPAWLIAPPLVLAGLAYPLPWVLDAPRIYEAAILWGAAFLIAGLVFAFPVLAGDCPRPGRLALAGILWGLAFASRAVLLLPIAALVAGIVWKIWRRSDLADAARRVRLAAALTVPIVVAGALIGLYNFDRFSNPLEFGYRFSIGPPAGQAEGSLAAFRLANIPVNLYNYAFTPAAIIAEPPYLRPLLASRSIGTITIPHPELFHGELVTGLAFTTPFLLFVVFLVWWLSCAPMSTAAGEARTPETRPRRELNLGLMVACIGLGCLAGLMPLLSIYVITPRYLLDVSPLLTILAGMGAWVAYDRGGSRTSRVLIGLAIVGTALASAVASVLLAFNNWLR